jgi:hypothetical protein
MVVDESAPPPKTDGSKSPLAGGETGGGHFVRKQAYFNVENHVSTSLRA